MAGSSGFERRGPGAIAVRAAAVANVTAEARFQLGRCADGFRGCAAA